jgi:ClpP class serine protease
VRFGLVSSGARKIYGNQHAELSEAELSETQKTVDAFARTFFELVAEARPLGVENIEALEAGVFVAADAKSHGLIDEVATLDVLLASIAGTESPAQSGKGAPMADEKKEESAKKEEDEAPPATPPKKGAGKKGGGKKPAGATKPKKKHTGG